MGEQQVTVKDIARRAGVSIGTVDRVMHNRSGVSATSRQKVVEAIEALGYRLNPFASLLANKKHFRIVCLLPMRCSGEYWELLYNGLAKAELDSANRNTSIEIIDYEQFSRQGFQDAVKRLTTDLPQAVIAAPIYHNEMLALAAELERNSIPLIYVDSRIEESDYLAYFGLPMFESGYLAGRLLLGDEPVDEVVNFRIERGATPIDDPTLQRREGFFNYVAQHCPNLQVYNEFIRPHDTAYNATVFERFYAEHPDTTRIITFNSRVHLIAGYLEAHQKRGYKVVGFDLLEKNRLLLREGYIDSLIVQRTEMQIRRAVHTLIDYLAFGTLPQTKDNLMPMDILLKENIDFYSEIYQD